MTDDPATVQRKRPWLRRRPVRERAMTPKQIILTGLSLIAAGGAFWVAVAVFPEVDWTSLRRVAFAGAVLPVVGVVLLGIALVKVIRSRVESSRVESRRGGTDGDSSRSPHRRKYDRDLVTSHRARQTRMTGP